MKNLYFRRTLRKSKKLVILSTVFLLIIAMVGPKYANGMETSINGLHMSFSKEGTTFENAYPFLDVVIQSDKQIDR